MFNLDDIPQALLLARGEYASVRAAHEQSKTELQILCGGLASIASQILRKMQPDNGAPTESADVLLATARDAIERIAVCAAAIVILADQRASLKTKAWR